MVSILNVNKVYSRTDAHYPFLLNIFRIIERELVQWKKYTKDYVSFSWFKKIGFSS